MGSMFWRCRRGTCAVAVLIGLAAGCTSGGSSKPGDDSTVPTTSVAGGTESSGSGEGPADGAELSVEQAVAMLDGVASGERPTSPLPEFDDHRADPAVLAVALHQLANGSERWVDVYVWANGGYSPEPLRRFVDHSDAELRYLASVGLVSMGDPSGFAPLVDALTDDTTIGDAEIPVWRLAATSLARLVPGAAFGPPYDASTTQREAAQAQWREWSATITAGSFDVNTGLWGAS